MLQQRFTAIRDDSCHVSDVDKQGAEVLAPAPCLSWRPTSAPVKELKRVLLRAADGGAGRREVL
jgi:hypothetical protein